MSRASETLKPCVETSWSPDSCLQDFIIGVKPCMGENVGLHGVEQGKANQNGEKGVARGGVRVESVGMRLGWGSRSTYMMFN